MNIYSDEVKEGIIDMLVSMEIVDTTTSPELLYDYENLSIRLDIKESFVTIEISHKGTFLGYHALRDAGDLVSFLSGVYFHAKIRGDIEGYDRCMKLAIDGSRNAGRHFVIAMERHLAVPDSITN